MKKLLLALFIFFAMLSSNSINAYTTYSIFDLGNMGGEETTASAVNNHGVVVGTVVFDTINYQSDAFKWENGQTTILPFLSDSLPTTGATSINDNNEIVGWSPSWFWCHVVMWDNENNINDSDCIGSPSDINENSQVVFTTRDNQASILWEDDSLKIIASYSVNGIDHSGPSAINENGQVVGWGYVYGEEGYGFAYLWENDNLYDLNDLITDGYSGRLYGAKDINNNSQIIGSSWLFEDGNVLDLGFSGAAAINEIGQIVGSNFLYENGRLYNLDELIESEISYTNLKANDINDLGQIVGQFDVNGETHAFLMNPAIDYTIVISKLETTPASVRPGDTVQTEVCVQNGDNPRLAYVSARVSDPMGDESDLGYTSYHFAPNETRTFAFQYTVPADADLGMYDLTAQLYEDCAGTCSNPIGLSFVADDAFEVSDEADIVPPAAIDDLSAESGDNRGEIELSWTATGDDDYTGNASGYIVKYATVPVTDVNWGSANTYEQNWMPEDPGVRETHILSGFPPGQELFFALKTVDVVLNASSVSNTASAEASSAEGTNYVDIPGTNFRIIAENINYTSDSEVEAKGNVSLNELIYFSGPVRIDLENAIISGEGNAFMPDVPLIGDVYLFKAGFEFDLGELIESNIEAISRVAGIDLQIDNMEFLWKDLKLDGIKISAKMKLPDYLVSGAIAVDDLVISRTDGISGTIDLDPEPEKLGIQINGCNWKLRDGTLSFDSGKGLFKGQAKLDMANFDLTADISFIEGQLYGVGMCYGCPEPGKVILIASGVPIVFLQEVCGGVENIPDPSKLILRATADITAGPKIQGYYLAKLDDAGMEVDISSRATLSGTLILGGFYELAYAEAFVDWHDVIFGANGNLNALNIFTAYTTLTIDAQKNISGSGEGKLSVPDGYWPISGRELAKVLGMLDNEGIKGEVDVQLFGFGLMSAAFAFDWNGNFSVAENLESLSSQTYMASQRLLSLEGQLMPVYVPEGMEVIYIKVTWTGDGDSTVELVKPDSTRITPGSCEADPDCYYQDDAPQEAWYALRNPDSGQWHVDIIDPTNLGDIAVDVLSSNSKPLIQLTEPPADISTSTSADISWVDSDPDDNASISLWYDVDQQGYDGSLIISGINEDDVADGYVWDVTSIPTGRYYIYAQIDDKKNAPLRCYAPGMVEVINPLYPGRPTNLQATVNGKVVELSWDAVADCVYMLHYTDNITSEVYDSYFSLTDENHWIADAALAGKEVKFAVQAVQAVEIGEGQIEMRASLVSAPVVVTIPDRPGILVEPNVIEFGDVSPETSTVKVATISNMGNEDLLITCLKFVGSDKEAFNVDRDCPLTIGPGANEPIGIELIPNKQGAYSALFQIVSDDPQKAVCEIGLSATVNYLCDGDFNDDGDLDGSDLSVFAADFGRTDCSGNCDGDFDENGNVDESDLAAFAAAFGRTGCPH